ncbi:MAG: DUF692 domain-containing protein [Pseudomonadota bacterium]
MTELPATSLPAIAGLPFKHSHFPEIVASGGGTGWFEVHAENYMGDGGPPHRMLEEVRSLRPLSIHGVGLSIGGEGRLDRDHLARLRRLIDRFQPASFSEHLAWSTHDGVYFNDLLPLPYNAETVARVASHIDETQEALGRRMLLENPSSYTEMTGSTMAEIDFLTEIARRTGCGLLLDVNNVYISANNQGFVPDAYLADFPVHLVGEVHLAGHATEIEANGGRLLIDSHDRRVDEAVWSLFEQLLGMTGPLPTLVEWDSDIPEFTVLQDEAAIADRALSRVDPAHIAAE